jgi:serine phosphatase RsbU (regulator of sigma subunit)
MKSIMIVIFLLAAGVLIISACIGRILYIYFDSILVKPISTLNKETRHMIENIDNDEEVMTGIHTGDELEELSKSFEQMSVDVRRYIKENMAVVAEKERIGADLQLASKIQMGMLPHKNDVLQDVRGFNLFASMTPAKEVGGDFYDFYMLDDTHIVILIADVSDKGAGAAFFMAISKTLIKARAGMGGSSAEILAYVDKMIAEKNAEGMFVTVWFAIIDLETGHVDACNAGHDYPAIMKHGEDYVIEKTVHGPPIGFIPGAKHKSYEFTLEPGDRIFLYTDGVNEAKRPDGKRYGFDRLLEVLNSNKSLMSEELVETVKESVQEFAGEEPQFDDMTMLSFIYERRAKNS